MLRPSTIQHVSAEKNWDQCLGKYKTWKKGHACDINFTGSAPAMDIYGMLELFKRSLGFKLQYANLILVKPFQ